MYKNPGKLIKTCVSVYLSLGFAASALISLGIIIMGLASEEIVGFLLSLLLAAVSLILLCLTLWLSGLTLYAFGEMVEHIADIRETLQKPNPVYIATESAPATHPTNVDPNWITTIYKLPAKDLQHLLTEKRQLFSDAELAMIEDALIQRTKNNP